VVSPSFLRDELACEYPRDAATVKGPAWQLDPKHARPVKGCREAGGSRAQRQTLPPAAHGLKEAMEQQAVENRARDCFLGLVYRSVQTMGCYNEIVLRVGGEGGWDASLPAPVQAFVVNAPPASKRAEAVAKQHGAFLRHFGLSAAQVPLLRFDFSRMEAPVRTFETEVTISEMEVHVDTPTRR
jgi:hypothetical protein